MRSRRGDRDENMSMSLTPQLIKPARLSGVTLCAIESRPSLAIVEALSATLEQVECDEVLFLAPTLPKSLPEHIRHVPIPEFRNVAEYSHYVLKRLADHVSTPHVLLIQWDGFVLDGRSWNPQFLDCDYIGAPWPHVEAPFSVGNGGFSLRSRTLLLACQDSDFIVSQPEDMAICKWNRQLLAERYGIKFASPELAASFSCEHGPMIGPTFGFHGIFNFPHVYPERLDEVLEGLDDLLLHNRDARTLCVRLLRSRNPEYRAIGRRFLKRLILRTPWNKHNWLALRNLLLGW